MARPNWEYIRIDVLLPDHPKLDGLTYTAKWTLIELWAHCGQHLTDGFVRTAVWRRAGTASARQMLLDHNLAEPVDNGYQMHDYLEHQRSRAEVEELRKKRSEAGRRGGRAKANAVANASLLPPLATASKRSKFLAEAEAEAEADKTPVADVPDSKVEGVIHRPPENHSLSHRDEQRRQLDALTEWEREHGHAPA